uniref:Uncharacterized protein n=1 Tax=Megaselia scalaris TaxID=36166 RepID=T1GQJ4_MEGSC
MSMLYERMGSKHRKDSITLFACLSLYDTLQHINVPKDEEFIQNDQRNHLTKPQE